MQKKKQITHKSRCTNRFICFWNESVSANSYIYRDDLRSVRVATHHDRAAIRCVRHIFTLTATNLLRWSTALDLTGDNAHHHYRIRASSIEFPQTNEMQIRSKLHSMQTICWYPCESPPSTNNAPHEKNDYVETIWLRKWEKNRFSISHPFVCIRSKYATNSCHLCHVTIQKYQSDELRCQFGIWQMYKFTRITSIIHLHRKKYIFPRFTLGDCRSKNICDANLPWNNLFRCEIMHY